MKTYLRPVLVLSVILLLSAACRLSDGPDKPDQTIAEKRYTLKVEYIRVDVKRPDLMGKAVTVSIIEKYSGKSLAANNPIMDKKDDYHYQITFSNILETESYGTCYYIYGKDSSRWDGVDDNTAVVGDRFILTVVETGSTLELINILLNNLPFDVYKDSQARMAKCCLLRNGTLTNGD